jgi:hypothetical protein
MYYDREWEFIDSCTRRMEVPAGWIVQDIDTSGGAMCFVPDPDHAWRLAKEKKE